MAEDTLISPDLQNLLSLPFISRTTLASLALREHWGPLPFAASHLGVTRVHGSAPTDALSRIRRP